MGVCTFANVKNTVINNERVVVADVTPSNSYATGGETVSLGLLGLKQVHAAYTFSGSIALSSRVPESVTVNPSGVQLVLAGTLSAPKLKAYSGSTSEVSSTTDLSATPAVRIEFRGN